MIRLCAFLALFLMLAGPVLAQQAMPSFSNSLQVLNQTPVTQSLRFKTEQDMFAMRVLDPGHQLLGKVDDLLIDESGGVAKLVSEINMVGRNENTVQNDAYEFVFHEHLSAFEIPLGYEGTKDVSPESLAAITPAAGGGHLYSLKAMIGAEVKNEEGRWLGEIKHAVFDDQAQFIRALVLEDVPGARRYTDIALPFDPKVVRMIDVYGRVEVRVDNAAAKEVTDFAKAQR